MSHNDKGSDDFIAGGKHNFTTQELSALAGFRRRGIFVFETNLY